MTATRELPARLRRRAILEADIRRLRRKHGAAFTMERALNRTLAEPLLLARLDANDVPGGKRPLIELVGDEPVVLEGATASRARYFDEQAVVA